MALLRPVVSWRCIAMRLGHEKSGLVLGSIPTLVTRSCRGSRLKKVVEHTTKTKPKKGRGQPTLGYYHTKLFVNDGFNAQLPGATQQFLKYLARLCQNSDKLSDRFLVGFRQLPCRPSIGPCPQSGTTTPHHCPTNPLVPGCSSITMQPTLPSLFRKYNIAPVPESTPPPVPSLERNQSASLCRLAAKAFRGPKAARPAHICSPSARDVDKGWARSIKKSVCLVAE